MRRASFSMLAFGLALLLGCAGEEQPPAPKASPKSAPAARGRRGAEPVAAADLDLAAMVAPVPEYEGSGRNLFVYGPEPRTTPTPPPPTPTARATPPPRPQPPPRQAPPAAGRIKVKYAGFVEKTGEDGAKSKYAIFLDGNEILAGAEGETVANRFRVVEIGLESVTVALAGSETTERIPLKSN